MAGFGQTVADSISDDGRFGIVDTLSLFIPQLREPNISRRKLRQQAIKQNELDLERDRQENILQTVAQAAGLPIGDQRSLANQASARGAATVQGPAEGPTTEAQQAAAQAEVNRSIPGGLATVNRREAEGNIRNAALRRAGFDPDITAGLGGQVQQHAAVTATGTQGDILAANNRGAQARQTDAAQAGLQQDTDRRRAGLNRRQSKLEGRIGTRAEAQKQGGRIDLTNLEFERRGELAQQGAVIQDTLGRRDFRREQRGEDRQVGRDKEVIGHRADTNLAAELIGIDARAQASRRGAKLGFKLNTREIQQRANEGRATMREEIGLRLASDKAKIRAGARHDLNLAATRGDIATNLEMLKHVNGGELAGQKAELERQLMRVKARHDQVGADQQGELKERAMVIGHNLNMVELEQKARVEQDNIARRGKQDRKSSKFRTGQQIKIEGAKAQLDVLQSAYDAVGGTQTKTTTREVYDADNEEIIRLKTDEKTTKPGGPTPFEIDGMKRDIRKIMGNLTKANRKGSKTTKDQIRLEHNIRTRANKLMSGGEGWTSNGAVMASLVENIGPLDALGLPPKSSKMIPPDKTARALAERLVSLDEVERGLGRNFVTDAEGFTLGLLDKAGYPRDEAESLATMAMGIAVDIRRKQQAASQGQ